MGDARLAAQSVNRFGLDLLAKDVGLAKGNVAMSPWSIATVLAMARVGANGDTGVEMDRVLHLGGVSQAHQAMNGLAQQAASRNGSFPGKDGKRQVVELTMANRAFAQQGVRFQQPFLDELARSYGTGVGLVDYRAATEAARGAINAWVDRRTRGRIPELLASGSLDRLTRLVLVNAVYLKADWAVPFLKDDTIEGTFHAPQGDVRVPFMRNSERRRFSAGDGWKAVELAYAGEKLAMTVFVPDAGRYDEVAGRLSQDILDAVDASEAVEVDLRLPKFEVDHAVFLKRQLSDLGMPTAFSDLADFSGMTTQDALQIADVVHQANVTVDEKGTVAAAATAAVFRSVSGSIADETKQLVVDRPFLFFIRDLPSGAVLFAGQITSPTTTR